MNRKNCFLLLFFVACCHLLPAQNLPSTLLWKISGNGLNKSSYLYGTMHLTDERIFNIGDSVYKAIENSDGFAIEISPDEFTPFVIDEAKKSYLKAQKLKDMMQEDEFKKYGKALAKKLNKNEDEITTADVLRQKNKWIEQSYSTGKMQTFLDVYLYDIARRQAKWIGGVEDLQDQENVIDLVDETDIEELAMDDNNTKQAYDQSEEILLQAYLKNNLNVIDSLANSLDSSYGDALLTKRNKKMAMRMDSMSHERSMVFAVGAAHLPGNSGLIALLRKKGFTVTPVFSSKKIKPVDYHVKEISLPWYDVKDENGYYTASMPGKAGDLTLYGILNMKMYFDVFASTLYMTTALRTPYSQAVADSIFGNVTSYYFGTADYKKGKPIIINNTPGRAFISTKNNYSRGYLLFKDGIMYMAIAMSMKQDSSAAGSINQFLKSFAINENISSSNANYIYTNKIKAYKVNLPAEPKSAGDMIPVSEDSSINTDLNIVTDPVTGTYFFFGTNDAAKGYFIENDSTILAGIVNSQKKKLTAMNVDTMFVKNGHRILEFGGVMAQVPLMMQTHYEFRGNRWYVLLAMYDTAKPYESVESFFNSFVMTDYEHHEWDSYTSPDKLFTTWSPLSFNYNAHATENEGDSAYKYEAFDTSRADNFGVIVQSLDKYFWRNSDTAMWNEFIKEKVGYNDSLLLKDPVTNGDVSGYEIQVKKNGANNIKRLRMLLNGGKVYSLITVQDASEINNANNNKFFEDFRFNAILPNNNVFVSKAGILLKDISSPDSVTRSKAFEYLSIAPFTKNELPLLHEALLKNYPADEDNDYDETKIELKKIILNINDSSSYSFAKSNYATAGEKTKNILLAIMASFPTQQNFNDIKSILINQPPRITPDYNLINPLTDSLELTATIAPDLLPLLKDTVMMPFIIDIAKTLLDSGLLDKELLLPYQSNILQVAQKNYTVIKNEEDTYDAINYDLLELLGKINTADCNVMLQKWSLLNQSYLQQHAVVILLRNKQSISPLAIEALAKNKETRTELYDSLKAYSKENLFPRQYHTQKYFAESYAYVAASDDDDYPNNITFLTQKLIDFKGRQSRFFFYKITYGEDDDANYSLACAGPFSADITDLSTENATGEIYYDEDFDPDNLPAQMKALIAQMEDWYTWKNGKEK